MDDVPGPKTQRQIERELEAELSHARRVFERVSRTVNQSAIDAGEIPPQDGALYLRSAREEADRAYADYREALWKFTEFAARGTVPPEHSGSADSASA